MAVLVPLAVALAVVALGWMAHTEMRRGRAFAPHPLVLFCVWVFLSLVALAAILSGEE